MNVASPSADESKPPPGYIFQVTILGVAASLPGLALGLALLWLSPDAVPIGFGPRMAVTLGFVGLEGLLLWRMRRRLVRPLQTLSNVLMGLREGDYSFQPRGCRPDDALGAVMLEVHGLVETMREQRLGAVEASALLRTVMGEIDVAVFAFDEARRLRLVNRAGERLLSRPSEQLLGRQLAEIGLPEPKDQDEPYTSQHGFPGASGRWRFQRRQVRSGGMPLDLLVVSDLSRELREEERQAWQRLVRVLGHELNNSLAPVKSIAGSLSTLLHKEPLPADWREDMNDGLSVIASRAESLNRFVGAYAQLARLPKPARRQVDLGSLISRVVSLENRCPVALDPGPEVLALVDPDQIEQALINLLRNAADAALDPLVALGVGVTAADQGQTRPSVRVRWIVGKGSVSVEIEDDGPGLANTANLFVPFFTTKQKGSGIGLLLSRQIAEGHGGSLVLENRPVGRGCVARLVLPLARAGAD